MSQLDSDAPNLRDDYFEPLLVRGGVGCPEDGMVCLFFQMEGAEHTRGKKKRTITSPPVIFRTPEACVRFLAGLVRLASEVYGVPIEIVPGEPGPEPKETPGPERVGFYP